MQPFSYTDSARPEVAAFLPDAYRTVLEIGCSSGGFSASLLPSTEYWGVEPDPDAAAKAVARGYRLMAGTFDEVAAQLPDHYFDVVVCNDVIEHMADHMAFLEQIKTKISPGGCIVGSIPNVRYYDNLFRMLWRKDWEYMDEGVLDRTHLRFFTEKSLLRTFALADYEIVAFAGVNDATKKVTGNIALRNWLIRLVRLLSFGYHSDIRFLHFAFNVKLAVRTAQSASPGR